MADIVTNTSTPSNNNDKENENLPENELEMREIPNSTENQPRIIRFSSILDPNAYATKKTVAQGMLDVALLTANASQLKYLLQMGERHEFYHLMITLISISIILQILIGALFIVIGRMNVNKEKHQPRANSLNNAITIGIFIITVDNILISSFGMKNSDNIA
ncbi:ninjurin-2-like isoform X2 [Limulus polyphemus]|uniref:Ninjurin-2-like isoform X2 n=1 Tax=Limulus polyphemus TaxID=6850 RepID=A0ABM1B7P5_LIMPO|nr:ninjurin-2-like isoform X2 [Limulus polyphemus]